MIVVVIIGILAAIAIPIFLNQQKAAIAASVKADVRSMHQTLMVYLVKNPTAASVSGNWTGLTSSTGQDAASQSKYKMIKTHENSQMTVSGSWDKYKITGRNTLLTGAFVFDSEKGTYVGTNDFA